MRNSNISTFFVKMVDIELARKEMHLTIQKIVPKQRWYLDLNGKIWCQDIRKNLHVHRADNEEVCKYHFSTDYSKS